jgi:hypothetical protein
MSLLTAIYKFIKPELTDAPPDITATNPNWDKLETVLEEIKDNHSTHLAESAKKHINESGSNANGCYIRFDDGTQICWRDATVDLTVETNQSFPYPAAFNVSSPRVATWSFGDGPPGLADYPALYSALVMGRATEWLFRTIGSGVTSSTDRLRLFVIGRWK